MEFATQEIIRKMPKSGRVKGSGAIPTRKTGQDGNMALREVWKEIDMKLQFIQTIADFSHCEKCGVMSLKLRTHTALNALTSKQNQTRCCR